MWHMRVCFVLIAMLTNTSNTTFDREAVTDPTD